MSEVVPSLSEPVVSDVGKFGATPSDRANYYGLDCSASETSSARSTSRSATPMKPKRTTATKSIDEIRAKQARAIEVLRRGGRAATVAALLSKSHKRQASEPAPNGGLSPVRQVSNEDSDTSLSTVTSHPTSAPGSFTHRQSSSQKPLPAPEYQEPQVDPLAQVVQSMCDQQVNLQRRLVATLTEFRKEHAQSVSDLRQAMQDQAHKLEALKSHDLKIAALRDIIEKNDQLDGARSRELQTAISSVQQVLAAQARDLEQLKGQDALAPLGALREDLASHGRTLGEIAPKAHEAQLGVAGVQASFAAHVENLGKLSTLVVAQHEEQTAELKRLQEGLNAQVENESLKVELRGYKERDVAMGSSQEFMANTWSEDRNRLQEEISRLTKRNNALGGELQQRANLAKRGPGSPQNHRALWLAAAVAVGAALPAIFSRLSPEPQGQAKARRHHRALVLPSAGLPARPGPGRLPVRGKGWRTPRRAVAVARARLGSQRRWRDSVSSG